MGPIDPMSEVFGRMPRGMSPRAQSIPKRHPDLKHKDNSPGKQGKTFRVRSRDRYKTDLTLPERNISMPLLFSVLGCFASAIILLVGIPMSLEVGPNPGFYECVGTELACTLITGLSILGASATGIYICSKIR